MTWQLNNNRLGDFPALICAKCPQLIRLDLSWNQLTGLPSAIAQLSHLESLDLSFNATLSALPPSIGHLSKLQNLAATDCSLTALPEELGRLRGLQMLHVQYNSLTTLPATVVALPRSCDQCYG